MTLLHDPVRQANAVTTLLLDRLADPDSTVADTRVPDDMPDDDPIWAALSLASGFPGVSLAFSGSSHREPEQTARAHAYLKRATDSLAQGGNPAGGIYVGPGSVAYATLIAHRATGSYRTALEGFDDFQRRLVRSMLPEITDAPVASNAEFEVVRGLTGIGRLLLARQDTCAPELRLILHYLTEMSQGEITHRGIPVPRWWTLAAPQDGREAELPDGHLNLGLSHGIGGPLALLSLAWRDGIRVEGHHTAIETLVELLKRWAVPDGDGIRWPDFLSLDAWAAGPDALELPWKRPSWCYGAPGLSRAVQLAALALDRPDWHDLAHRSLLPLLDRPPAAWGVEDAGLCHGWGGLLHLFGLLAGHIDDQRLLHTRDRLADLTLAQFKESNRFGFRSSFTGASEGADAPGFLAGATGTLLTLDAYTHGGRAHADWDMALLVA